jgi:2,4-dienoyl-CoA reductase-like NADH-dependent reductase (Old Yellow Enzyme family)/thioredoxin reductase
VRRCFEENEGDCTCACGYDGICVGRLRRWLDGGRVVDDCDDCFKHDKEKEMPGKYPNLTSPFKFGGNVLKNRLVATSSAPAHLLGPEPYITDPHFAHYVNKARSGASLIVLNEKGFVYYKPPETEEDRNRVVKFRKENPNPWNPEFGMDPSGVNRFPAIDLINGGSQHYLAALAEAIHFYDSKCVMSASTAGISSLEGYDVSTGNENEVKSTEGAMHFRTYKKVATNEMLMAMIDELAFNCSLLKECGLDGVYLHMAYRGGIMARMLSPLTNHRTDEFGGSHENRTRFIIMLADAIKKRCGKDFIIHAGMSGWEENGGYTVEDAAEFARLFQGHIDTLEVRGPDADASQTTNFILKEAPNLEAAAAIKKRAPGIAVVVNAGMQDIDISEEAIASGKADLIGAARAWICNLDYGRLVYEGRADDVIPCLRCNGCHLYSYHKSQTNFCAVNPIYGLEHKLGGMVSPATKKKKVAVVGGGPAGMQAACAAAERGHYVTLYEKGGHLGGNMKVQEEISFKWTHKKFNKYLAGQVAKHPINVLLHTEATPELVANSGYDAVIVAIGAEPTIPDIPGICGKNVITAAEVYGQEGKLPQDIVIVGGGETGVEAGMHLAELGKNVTVIEKAGKLAQKSIPIHFYVEMRHAWEKIPTFKFLTSAICTGVSEDGVAYVDADGNEKAVAAGIVVIAAGQEPKKDAALKFHGACGEFYMIGDCKAAGGMQNVTRSAYSAAVRL